MAVRLEDIKNGASVRGVASAQAVHVISVDWIGDQAISVACGWLPRCGAIF